MTWGAPFVTDDSEFTAIERPAEFLEGGCRRTGRYVGPFRDVRWDVAEKERSRHVAFPEMRRKTAAYRQEFPPAFEGGRGEDGGVAQSSSVLAECARGNNERSDKGRCSFHARSGG